MNVMYKAGMHEVEVQSLTSARDSLIFSVMQPVKLLICLSYQL